MTMRTSIDSCALITLLFGRTQYRLGAVVLTLNATAFSEVFFRKRLFSRVLLTTTEAGSGRTQPRRSSERVSSSGKRGARHTAHGTRHAARTCPTRARLTLEVDGVGREDLEELLGRHREDAGRDTRAFRLVCETGKKNEKERDVIGSGRHTGALLQANTLTCECTEAPQPWLPARAR